jgi:TolB-like protein/class 3 adenylate cyclase/Tfp pilus assembly protein PilF
MSSTRQLAAIMFTDIVGYTALMGKDEPKAMELVRKNREVQKPLIEKYNGSLLKEMGDGNLASFPTASDAIYCAREIQQSLYEDSELNLRIGIHLGEIRIEIGDIYGDGVNVASRLESIAEPGGIYISDAVQKSIRSQPDIQTAYLGELELKNVDYPVKTYAVRGEGLPRPKKTAEKHLSGRLMAELQRRNVFRAGLAYLALAFIVYSLLQLITLSSTITSIIYALLVLGVPVSIYMAWNFERSPDGFVRVTSRKAWLNPYSDTQKKPFTGNGMIIFLLIIIVGLIAFPKYTTNNNNSIVEYTETSISNKKSIAVLPFDNLSNDPEQLYFSDGIQEDILNHLAKIADLNVKSRSSTLQFRENRPSIVQIGEELRVGTILEGSVRKAGNMVRINAQLIDVETDDHIWSETYDRELTEVFKIQSEVAKEIARILELKLSSGEQEIISSIATDNITAYDYFLRARELWNARGDREDIISLLQQTIEMDPYFAEAYALLSRTLFQRGVRYGRNIWLDSALALANKAIELDPDVANGYVIRGLITDVSLGDDTKGLRDFEKAFELEPNNPFVLQRLGIYLVENNEPERGVPLIIKSIELEGSKKDPQYYLGWGDIYRYAGDLEKSRDLYLLAEKLAPEWNGPKNSLGSLKREQGDYYGAIEYFTQTENNDNIAWCYYFAGDIDKAEEYWIKLLEEESELEDTTAYFAVRHRLGMIYLEKGKSGEAIEYLNEQIELNQNDIDRNQIPMWTRSMASAYYDLTLSKLALGQTEEALELIENNDIIWAGVFTMASYMDQDPMFEPIRNDPRFLKLADELRNKSEAAKREFQKIIMEREANEQMQLGLDK